MDVLLKEGAMFHEIWVWKFPASYWLTLVVISHLIITVNFSLSDFWQEAGVKKDSSNNRNFKFYKIIREDCLIVIINTAT